MNNIIENINNYKILKEENTGVSGTRKKVWFSNGTDICLYKRPKKHEDGTFTTEHLSEYYSYKIGEILNLPVARTIIAKYNDDVGSYTYKIDNIVELTDLIQSRYVNYVPENFTDGNIIYNVNLIIDVLKDYISDIKEKLYKLVIFDFIIGNSDRHSSNIAIKLKNDIYDICDYYDNGSSLLAYIEEDDVDDVLNSEKRYNSILINKSKSCIGYNDERPIKWFDFIDRLKYDNVFLNVLNNIKDNSNYLLYKMQNILINDKYYSKNKTELLLKYLKDRCNYLWKN